MFFSKIKGHGTVIPQLTNWVVEDSFSGVYLFTGPKGVGKHTVAKQLSKYLTCTGTRDDTCRCENCRLFPSIPDYMDISDEDKNLKVSDIKDLEKFLSLVPYKSAKRVAVLDTMDRISYNAASSLLKIFEEIKDYALIIGVTERPERMLSTVRSRMTEIEFNSLKPDEYIDILKSLGHSSEKLKKLTPFVPHLSGSILASFQRYHSLISEVPVFISNLKKTADDDVISKVTQLDAEGYLPEFCEVYVLIFNEILKLYADGVSSLYLDDIDKIAKIKEDYSEDICLLAILKMRDALSQYCRGVNVNLLTRAMSAILWTNMFLKKEKVEK